MYCFPSILNSDFRLRNDLYYVGWGVKILLTSTLTAIIVLLVCRNGGNSWWHWACASHSWTGHWSATHRNARSVVEGVHWLRVGTGRVWQNKEPVPATAAENQTCEGCCVKITSSFTTCMLNEANIKAMGKIGLPVLVSCLISGHMQWC